MHRKNFPGRKLKRRETSLSYWKRQLDKKTRSAECTAPDEWVNKQITILETKVKEAQA